MSQTQLGRAAGVGQSTVANIESGLRGGLQSLAELAAALHISYRWLRDGEGEMELAPAWPFPRVKQSRWDACTDEDKAYVQGAINRALDECERDRLGNTEKAA